MTASWHPWLLFSTLKMMESAEVGSEQAVFEMYGLLYADFHVHCRKFKGQFGGPSLL